MDLHIKKQHLNEADPSELCKICGVSVRTCKMKTHLAKSHDVASESFVADLSA